MSCQQSTRQTSCHPHWFLHQAPETSSGALNPLHKAQQIGSWPMLSWKPTSQLTVWWRHVPHHVLCISSNFFSVAFCKNISQVGGSEFTSFEIKCYFLPSKQKEISYTVGIMNLQGHAKTAITCNYSQYLHHFLSCHIDVILSLKYYVEAKRPALLAHEAEAVAASNEWAHLAHNTSSFRRMVQSDVPQVEGKPHVPWHAQWIVKWPTICSLTTTTYISLGN